MINDEIREITRRFVEALHPEKVILFGSYAKDTYRDDSDYDFFIIMPDGTKDMLSVMQRAYTSLRDMEDRNSVDILANTVTDFNERSKRATMEKEAFQDGVVLYG